MQYFTGEKVFQKHPPMNTVDMTKFRKRIGTIGAEKTFKISLMVKAKDITAQEMKMVSDIARKMDDHQLSFYGKDLALYVRVINQERNDKDKVYSLHELEVQCISKGKNHKNYEFGNKSAIAKTGSGLIVSALAFKGDPYYGHTLSAHWELIRRLTGHTPKEILTDRYYRGKKSVGSTEVSIPTSGSPKQSYYEKRKARKKFCNRAGIEPVIGHLKLDYRMMWN